MRQRTSVLAAIILGIGLFVVAGTALANNQPLPHFSVSSGGGTPLSVRFDASASEDPDGRIVSYQWVFGDGYTGSGNKKTHVYAAPGDYEVTLMVFDDAGAGNSSTSTITVSEANVSMGDNLISDKAYQRADVPTGLQVGQAAPLFTLPDLQGANHNLSDYLGKVVILEFWRTTCSHCLASLPHLEDLRADLTDDNVVVITVILNGSPQDAANYLAKEGLGGFINLWQPSHLSERPSDIYQISFVPHTILIDRYGVIRYNGLPDNLVEATITPFL